MRISTGWRSEEWPGFEHVLLTGNAGGWHAQGSVIMAGDELTTVRYEFDCDSSGRFTRLEITAATAAGDRALTLTASATAAWTADSIARPDLSGCSDIDINCTPLTNTLPVRRLPWAPAQARDLTMAYVSVPDLTVRPVPQRYTLLRKAQGSRAAVYRYESGSFRADLTVDPVGLVIDYPGCWQRIGRVATADASTVAR